MDDRKCAEPDCVEGRAHRWIADSQCGGCDSNWGVQALGGTCYESTQRCPHCGCARVTTVYGSQRNPGERDRVEYDRYAFESDDDAE